jgi:Domain of unknown function (DUF4136)
MSVRTRLLQHLPAPQGGLAVALVLLSACHTAPEIRANADPAVNLSGYRTYGFETRPGTDRAVSDYFEVAISREMDARGYLRVDSNPNLLVSFSASVQERAVVDSTPGPLSGDYYGARAGMSTPPEVTTVRSQLGTAIIDVVDTSRWKVVWTGSAEGLLSRAAARSPKSAVDTAVTQMFAQFPGRAGAWGHSAEGAPSTQAPWH